MFEWLKNLFGGGDSAEGIADQDEVEAELEEAAADAVEEAAETEADLNQE